MLNVSTWFTYTRCFDAGAQLAKKLVNWEHGFFPPKFWKFSQENGAWPLIWIQYCWVRSRLPKVQQIKSFYFHIKFLTYFFINVIIKRKRKPFMTLPQKIGQKFRVNKLTSFFLPKVMMKTALLPSILMIPLLEIWTELLL